MPKPKEYIIDEKYPFIRINEEYEFEKTDDLKVKVSYIATGETATVKVSMDNVNYNYWAHSDYNIETLTDRYKSRIAIWLDESNIWYPKKDESIKFENLRCGATYKLNIGYMLVDGTYITDAIYIQTWKLNIILTEIHSRHVICELSSNYPGRYEWWSDQDSTKRTTQNGLTKINISEFVDHRDFITIYARILGMDDTRSAEEKIYIPLLYENSEINISGTSIIIKPKINTEYTDNEISWAVSIEEENIYNEYKLSQNVAFISNLKPATHYELKVIIKYKSPEQGILSDYEDVYLYKITTYGAHVIDEIDKKINSFKLQLAETIAECYQAIDVFNINPFYHKNYNVFVVKKDDNGNYDTSNHTGKVIIDQNDETVEVLNLEYNTEYRVYIYLDEVKNFINYNNDTFIYYDIHTLDIVKCGEFECNVTAKSCTITPIIEAWNGSSELYIKTKFYCEELNDIQAIDTILFKNDIHNIFIDTLKSGYKYQITFEAYDNYRNEISINPLEITTYGVHVEFEDEWIHTKYVDYIRFRFIEGMKSATVKQRAGLASSCRWWISSDPNDSESIIFGPYDLNLSIENPFDYLMGKKEYIFLPNKTYYMYTMINGITLNGINDSIICYPFTTKNCISNINYSTNISGTTINLHLDYIEPKIKDYEYNLNIKLYDSNNIEIANADISSLQDILFTKLINGGKYRIAITGYDSEDNTTSNYITINGDNIFYVETYKLLFSNLESSTRAIRWTTASNLPLPEDSKIESIIQYNDNDFKDNWLYNYKIDINKQTTLDKINHDTTVDIALRVNNIVDENGNLDIILYSKGIRTRKLSVEIKDATFDANNAKLKYDIYSNSTKINKDPIVLSNIRVLKDKSYAWEYENEDSEKIQAIEVNDTTINFTDLKLDTTYNFIIAATDEYNTVFSDSYINNTVPHVVYIYNRIKQMYEKAIPYLFHNGRFVKTSIYIYHNNKWHETY